MSCRLELEFKGLPRLRSCLACGRNGKCHKGYTRVNDKEGGYVIHPPGFEETGKVDPPNKLADKPAVQPNELYSLFTTKPVSIKYSFRANNAAQPDFYKEGLDADQLLALLDSYTDLMQSNPKHVTITITPSILLD